MFGSKAYIRGLRECIHILLNVAIFILNRFAMKLLLTIQELIRIWSCQELLSTNNHVIM